MIDKAALLRFVRSEERLYRNLLRAEDKPFDRGYNLGQAHAFGLVTTWLNTRRAKRRNRRTAAEQGS